MCRFQPEVAAATFIDLSTGIDDFAKTYRTYGKDMKLIVKYADDFPE